MVRRTKQREQQTQSRRQSGASCTCDGSVDSLHDEIGSASYIASDSIERFLAKLVEKRELFAQIRENLRKLWGADLKDCLKGRLSSGL
jgi:hypothetical protein